MMGEWKPQDWALLLTAVGTLLTAMIASIGAVLSNLAKIKAETVENKVDHNTTITVEGTASATANAKVAATAATEVKETTDAIKKKLNGGIDAAIAEALEPVNKKMEEIDKSMRDFVTNNELKGFADYVHQRNHDILNAINGLTMRLAVSHEIESLRQDVSNKQDRPQEIKIELHEKRAGAE